MAVVGRRRPRLRSRLFASRPRLTNDPRPARRRGPGHCRHGEGTSVPSDYPVYHQGDWAYWRTQNTRNDEFKSAIGRTPTGLQAAPVALYDGTGSCEGAPAALGDWLVYLNCEQRLIYRKMPAIPCSAKLPCPEGMSCGGDAVCH